MRRDRARSLRLRTAVLQSPDYHLAADVSAIHEAIHNHWLAVELTAPAVIPQRLACSGIKRHHEPAPQRTSARCTYGIKASGPIRDTGDSVDDCWRRGKSAIGPERPEGRESPNIARVDQRLGGVEAGA
jgi:hypothetical protein